MSTPASKTAGKREAPAADGEPAAKRRAADAEAAVARGPSNKFVSAMLTDLYQISMAYAYWHAGKHEAPAVFDLFFRRNPFKGEYTIFAGLDEVLALLSTYRFTPEQVAELRARFPSWRPGFWDWLGSVDASQVRVYAVQQGTIVFPREPLIRVEGPLGVAQLLETTLLCLVNYPSLVATNAARHRVAVGPGKNLLEFGLRRAQGPDGAMSATKYAVIGGFDGTSNVQAAVSYGTDCKGTHAHSYVVSFSALSELHTRALPAAAGGKEHDDFVGLVLDYRRRLGEESTNDGELAAFVSYAQAYPSGFLALIDTYDTLNSGLYNFLSVALALDDLGHRAVGVRLDSGDLAFFSKQCRAKFREVGEQFGRPHFAKFTIVASNDLSEKVLYALNEQGHEIDSFGIGTNLVTCKDQPALGCVYKLVEINGKPRIKISAEAAKVTIPGRKAVYRLYDSKGEPVVDLLTFARNDPPAAGKRVLCRHPFDANKRVNVVPSRVEPLLGLAWDGALVREAVPTLHGSRERVSEQMQIVRPDHLRRLNPTPYKVALTSDLFDYLHRLWLDETPVREIS